METEILQVGDGPARYRRFGGSGPALVLLHGLASNGTRWSELARTSEPLRDWRVLVPDLRGQGLSEFRGRICAEDWFRDLWTMLDQEGVDDCVIGGHCLGANLSARFALRWPRRVRGLILVEPVLSECWTGALAGLVRLRGLPAALAALALAANRLGLYRRSLPPLDLEDLDRETRRRMAGGAGRAAITRRYGSPLHDLRHVPVSSYLQHLDETLRPVNRWSEIRAPTLALLSAGSRFGDLAQTQAVLRTIQPHRIVALEAEHWIHAEQPELLRRHIEIWLGELADGSFAPRGPADGHPDSPEA